MKALLIVIDSFEAEADKLARPCEGYRPFIKAAPVLSLARPCSRR